MNIYNAQIYPRLQREKAGRSFFNAKLAEQDLQTNSNEHQYLPTHIIHIHSPSYFFIQSAALVCFRLVICTFCSSSRPLSVVVVCIYLLNKAGARVCVE